MPNPLKRILVPVDFNVPSRAALSVANDLAAALDASIDVLHVIDLPDGLSMASEGYVPLPENYRQAVERHATEQLKDWLPTTSAPASASQHIAEGKPSVEIVRYADDHRADLIVMGTHGRTGVPHLVIGSVAESVVRGAHCPVLTVREPRSAA